MKKLINISIFLIICGFAKANVTLPRIFGENMVIQRDKPVRVWGWASANEKISVKFNLQIKSTKADKSGKWQIMLSPEKAGGPFQLIVKGKNLLTINNILVGEVWICSGQSNMEMTLAGWGVDNSEQEIAAADYPQIRQFKVPYVLSTSLKEDFAEGNWKICNPVNAGEFSAAAYFFARELYNRLKVPIGLINSSWGGSQVEGWISQSGFAGSQELKYIDEAMKTTSLDDLYERQYESVKKKIQETQGGLFSEIAALAFKETNFDDSNWTSLKFPGYWENQGFMYLDGFVWVRKTIQIDETDAGQTAKLELSRIYNHDTTYVNGEKVGESNSTDITRKYRIHSGILKPGKNVIAIRVENPSGRGGFLDEKSVLKLVIGEKVIGLDGDWKFRVESTTKPGRTMQKNDYPCILYNSMLNPVIPFTIRGAIWYQGEANTDRAFQYRTALPLLITDWRRKFNQGDFPFYFVQLTTFGSANDNSTSGSPWAELREAQSMALLLPDTGMSVTTDIGNPADIHPKNKQDVGRRLADIALHDLFGIPGEYTGPVFQAMKTNGNRIKLNFSHTGSGLTVKDKFGYIKGFEMAGADKKFLPASAEISGEKVILSNEKVPSPVAVRYNWADDASEGNLYNKEQFPAAPFRTDNWEGKTDKIKFSVGD